jgi:hypothetical protein
MPSAAALVACLMLLLPVVPAAHDVPSEVQIRMFVRPEGRQLRVLVRVPLVAMRDMDYPRRGSRSGFLLDLAQADATLRDAATLWVSDDLDFFENGAKLPSPAVASVRASLPSDQSFASYDEALAHVTGPKLPDDAEYVWAQGVLDVLFEYPIQSAESQFSVQPRLARLGLRTLTTLRFLSPGGAGRAFEFPGDPGLIQLDPTWRQAALQFGTIGFAHILDAPDHLLFLFCLVIPFRRVRSLLAVVISFTVAHSITLIASVYVATPDVLWFPPLIETLLAASIVYMALENIVSPQLKRRWLITFGVGLAYGFGFALALRPTLQFAGSHLLPSLLSYNAGVELGQVLVLVLAIPALDAVFRYAVAERLGTIILSALAAHTAWHWTTERWDLLRQYRFQWPAMDAAFWVVTMRGLMLLVVAAALYWLVFSILLPTASAAAEPVVGEKS